MGLSTKNHLDRPKLTGPVVIHGPLSRRQDGPARVITVGPRHRFGSRSGSRAKAETAIQENSPRPSGNCLCSTRSMPVQQTAAWDSGIIYRSDKWLGSTHTILHRRATYYHVKVDRHTALPCGISTICPCVLVARLTYAQRLQNIVRGVWPKGGGQEPIVGQWLSVTSPWNEDNTRWLGRKALL